jgi:hypothetical protein
MPLQMQGSRTILALIFLNPLRDRTCFLYLSIQQLLTFFQHPFEAILGSSRPFPTSHSIY